MMERMTIENIQARLLVLCVMATGGLPYVHGTSDLAGLNETSDAALADASPGVEPRRIDQLGKAADNCVTGFLDGMSERKVIALSNRLVLLCYARVDGGGCKAAAHSGLPRMPLDMEERQSHQLAELQWSPAQLFHTGSVSRLEVERLGAKYFVVCFNVGPSSIVACSLGATEAEAYSENGVVTLTPFRPPLQLGAGRLLVVTVTTAGRFSACHLPGNETLPGESEVDYMHALALASAGQRSGVPQPRRRGRQPRLICPWVIAERADGGPGLSLAATEPPLRVIRQ